VDEHHSLRKKRPRNVTKCTYKIVILGLNTLLVPDFSIFSNLVLEFSFVSYVVPEFKGKNQFSTSVKFSVQILMICHVSTAKVDMWNYIK
jgi:hypothetical protein